MKFNIKTSAIGLSDKKFAPHGEYETEDKQEIDRLREIAKKFPEDIEEVKGKAQTPAKKDEDETPDDPQGTENQVPKEDPKKTEGKPANNSKR
ncbi:hypothetical protein IPN35_00995 [Candidatus Peregrinibacteria bacterium]|nr:MAG: hypothetical protein IPN35_00995 [Candidatus Peregrinibacteria bacterium]